MGDRLVPPPLSPMKMPMMRVAAVVVLSFYPLFPEIVFEAVAAAIFVCNENNCNSFIFSLDSNTRFENQIHENVMVKIPRLSM